MLSYHDVPGNRGITGAAIIETSHIVMRRENDKVIYRPA
jgi:hypothetical protein